MDTEEEEIEKIKRERGARAGRGSLRGRSLLAARSLVAQPQETAHLPAAAASAASFAPLSAARFGRRRAVGAGLTRVAWRCLRARCMTRCGVLAGDAGAADRDARGDQGLVGLCHLQVQAGRGRLPAGAPSPPSPRLAARRDTPMPSTPSPPPLPAAAFLRPLCQVILTARAFKLQVTAAPDPRDLIWPNATATRTERLVRGTVTSVGVDLFGAIFFVILLVAIQGLNNIDNLSDLPVRPRRARRQPSPFCPSAPLLLARCHQLGVGTTEIAAAPLTVLR